MQKVDSLIHITNGPPMHSGFIDRNGYTTELTRYTVKVNGLLAKPFQNSLVYRENRDSWLSDCYDNLQNETAQEAILPWFVKVVVDAFQNNRKKVKKGKLLPLSNEWLH